MMKRSRNVTLHPHAPTAKPRHPGMEPRCSHSPTDIRDAQDVHASTRNREQWHEMCRYPRDSTKENGPGANPSANPARGRQGDGASVVNVYLHLHHRTSQSRGWTAHRSCESRAITHESPSICTYTLDLHNSSGRGLIRYAWQHPGANAEMRYRNMPLERDTADAYKRARPRVERPPVLRYHERHGITPAQTTSYRLAVTKPALA